ncbi:MAG: hypothetical protein ACYDD4_08155 [Acidimicrobiales bacterium]
MVVGVIVSLNVVVIAAAFLFGMVGRRPSIDDLVRDALRYSGRGDGVLADVLPLRHGERLAATQARREHPVFAARS